MAMFIEFVRRFPADHPSLAGHFPSSPIVPGVVILDEVTDALQEWRGAARLVAIRWVKFSHPLLPEQTFSIRLTAKTEYLIDFECHFKNRLLVQGQLELAVD